MKKPLYIAGTITAAVTISLLIIQIILSSNIKKEIIQWCNARGIESSNFNCGVNLATGSITLRKWTLKKADNDILIEKAKVFFKTPSLFSESKNIVRRVHIQKAVITLKQFPLFYQLLATNNSDTYNNNPNNPFKNSFLIEELKIENSILRIKPSGGNNKPDIKLEASFNNIGKNNNTLFSVKAIANSSSLEIEGDFNFDDWKKHLTYQIIGNRVSLGIINILEEGFLPTKVKEQLLSLYFKDILMVNLKGKLDIIGSGEIKEQNIDSQLKFLVSDLSCETDNERIKSLIKKIGTKDYLEINYKIYGTIKNPYLTYDILF